MLAFRSSAKHAIYSAAKAVNKSARQVARIRSGAFQDQRNLHQSPRKHARSTVGEELEVKRLSQSGVEFDAHVEIVRRRPCARILLVTLTDMKVDKVASPLREHGPGGPCARPRKLASANSPSHLERYNSPLNFLSSAWVGNRYALANANAVTRKPTRFIAANRPLQFRGMKPGSRIPYQLSARYTRWVTTHAARPLVR